MSRLNTAPNIARPDDLYERLIALHAGRTDEESAVVNAKLVMLLINHIGDEEVISEAISLAGSKRAERNQETESGGNGG